MCEAEERKEGKEGGLFPSPTLILTSFAPFCVVELLYLSLDGFQPPGKNMGKSS